MYLTQLVYYQYMYIDLFIYLFNYSHYMFLLFCCVCMKRKRFCNCLFCFSRSLSRQCFFVCFIHCYCRRVRPVSLDTPEKN